MPTLVALAVAVALFVVASIVLTLRARRRSRGGRPAREASAYVILEGNVWEACQVDDVREPWGRYATEPVRGFCGVPPGRHCIRTATANGDATLDFVIYPGELLAWRLDPERARWAPHDVDVETRALLEGGPGSGADVTALPRPKLPGYLVHLRTTLGMAAARASVPTVKPDGDALERVRRRLAKLVARAEGANDGALAELAEEARALGEALVGRPLTRREIRSVVATPRDAATRLLSAGHVERAKQILGLGLAVLPADPELMVAFGCALAAHGEADEAMRALEAALERDRCLDADDVARAMRARLELRARFGPRVRVG